MVSDCHGATCGDDIVSARGVTAFKPGDRQLENLARQVRGLRAGAGRGPGSSFGLPFTIGGWTFTDTVNGLLVTEGGVDCLVGLGLDVGTNPDGYVQGDGDGTFSVTTTIPFADLLGPAAVSFTPSWNNLTEGSGANSGYYIQWNDLMIFVAQFTFAADSSITGAPALVIPNSGTSILVPVICTATYREVGGGISYKGFGEAVTAGTAIDLYCEAYNPTSGTNPSYVTRAAVSATVPFTFNTDDIIRVGCVAILT